MRQYLRRDDTHHIAAFTSSGRTIGIISFRLSRWDTEHFGYNVALIEAVIISELDYDQKLEITKKLLAEFHTWCQAAQIRFVSVKLSALDLPVIHGFEHCGFNYLESWIYNKYDLNRVDQLGQTSYELRLARPTDCDFMLKYAKGAFATHRFHADSHIAPDKAETLYEKWILTAFNDPNQRILTLDVEDRPVAFMIYYKNDLRPYFGLQFAMWKMGLLDPKSRGRGLGTDFFMALPHYHYKEGLDVVDSGLSIRNLASLNLHNKLNFKVVSVLVTLHKWLR